MKKERLGIDVGISHLDVVRLDHENHIVTRSWPVETHDANVLYAALEQSVSPQTQDIFITGWGAQHAPDEIQGVPVHRVREIDAIGRGGLCMAVEEEALVVSMGSGTCLVSARGEHFEHRGGTAVGGLTLLGLGQRLTNARDIASLIRLAEHGDLGHVDFNLSEVYPAGIGILPPEATAAHFGRAEKSTPADLALGVFNLVAQTVGIIAILAAQQSKHRTIIFTGRVASISLVQDLLLAHIKPLAPKISFYFLENSAFATARGAIEPIEKRE